MSDIWSIIGISSLVASVVTVLVGIVKDIVVEKYRFKRQSEAGYVQKQIQIYSQIYFYLKRHMVGATTPFLFGERIGKVQEISSIIEANSSFLEPRIVSKWLSIWASLQDYLAEPKPEKLDETVKKAAKLGMELASMVKEIMNSNLIPKYRKIVGETVPDLC